jgi:hypothetical protein
MDGKDQAQALYGGPENATEQMSHTEARDLFGQSQSEDELHRACVQWADAQAGAMPELNALFHPPNGGARDGRTGARMKALGAKAGVPDLVLPIVRPVTWRNGERIPAGGLWIELKSQSGRLRDTQKTWRARLLKHQHCWILCRTLEAFQAAVTDYIAGDFEQPDSFSDS